MGKVETATGLKRDPVLATTVLVFALLAFVVGGAHEPWADEAQAWLIARDASLYDILFVLPSGELNPSLWHLMLIFPSTFLSYEALRYIALFFGILGVVVLVSYAPFPKPIKIALPFTYFIFFQYTVVARSYCLFAVLVFAIAALHKHRFDRPLAYSILVALLVYTHSFGALVSLGLIGTFVLDLLTQRRYMSRRQLLKKLACIGIPIATGCFLLYQVFPIRQRKLKTRWHFEPDYILEVLKVSLNESFVGITALSLVILAISMFWFWQRKVLLLYATMVIPFVTIAAIKFYNYWHLGLLFLVWIMVLWIAFESRTKNRTPIVEPYTRKAVLGCMYVVIGFHVYWAASAAYADYKGSYSCGRDVAQLLKQNDIKERRVYARNFWSIAALPYFEGKMFYNINPQSDIGYWLLFEPDRIERTRAIFASKPDAIVFGNTDLKEDFEGYVRTNFEGNLYWKDQIKERNHCTVYIRKDLHRAANAGLRSDITHRMLLLPAGQFEYIKETIG